MAGAWPVHGVFGSSEEMDENKSRRLRPDSSRNVGAPRGASRLESVATSPSGKFGERCSIDRPIDRRVRNWFRGEADNSRGGDE